LTKRRTRAQQCPPHPYHFRSEGIHRVKLFAESNNAQAIAFYQRLGFVHEGMLRDFYKRADETHYVDEYVMGLLLERSDVEA